MEKLRWIFIWLTLPSSRTTQLATETLWAQVHTVPWLNSSVWKHQVFWRTESLKRSFWVTGLGTIRTGQDPLTTKCQSLNLDFKCENHFCKEVKCTARHAGVEGSPAHVNSAELFLTLGVAFIFSTQCEISVQMKIHLLMTGRACQGQ